MGCKAMTIHFPPKCYECKHKRRGLACDAFQAIPASIIKGEVDHTQPYPGDNGIRFEPIDDEQDDE